VQKQFERWRVGKQGRGKIPPMLWDAAAKLCERHSVDRVAQWLRLNHTALRDRAKETGSAGSRKSPTFVELAPSAVPTALAEYLLEVEHAGERTLRVRVRGGVVADVVVLARALRQG